jgi:hypothetical protein
MASRLRHSQWVWQSGSLYEVHIGIYRADFRAEIVRGCVPIWGGGLKVAERHRSLTVAAL